MSVLLNTKMTGGTCSYRLAAAWEASESDV